jgi:glutamate dehydrogenase
MPKSSAAAAQTRLLGEVDSQLGRMPAVKGEAIVPEHFAQLLYGRTALEDLMAFPVEALARSAAEGFAHLTKARGPEQAALGFFEENFATAGRQRQFTVLQVVNDNMPFLLDSTLAELAEQGCEPRLVAHPILAVKRNPDGRIEKLLGEASGPAPAGTRRESLIQIHIDRIDDPAVLQALRDGLTRVYADVRTAVADWSAMQARVTEAIQAYRANPPPLAVDETSEAIKFLEWINSDNFTLLGVRAYRFPDSDVAADPVPGTGLGILRDPDVKVLRRGRELVVMSPEIRAFFGRPQALIITKANVKSRVHRRVHLDYIGVKLFTADGRLDGELRIIGLMTSNAYTGSTLDIPYLRHKITQVAHRAGFDAASYSGRALMNVLDSYPRDELFQMDATTLERFAIDILQLTERPRIRALARTDEFDRFVSVLVFIPKDRYDTSVRRRVGQFLAGVFAGRISAAYPAYPDGPLARTHYIIGRDEGRTPKVEQDKLEAGIASIVRTWTDNLRDELESAKPGPQARALAERYAEAFGAAYRENVTAGESLKDIATLQMLGGDKTRAVDLYRREGDAVTRANLKVFAIGAAIPLSARVPVLENMGFSVINERTYTIAPQGVSESERVWLHDMALARSAGGPIDVTVLDPMIEAALMAQFRGLSESDRFDRLVLEAGLAWREAALLRAFGRYLRQAGAPYAQDYIADALARHGEIARLIVALFNAKFDPHMDAASRDKGMAVANAAIEERLASVTSLDEDRILRRIVNLVDAAVRTNLFQIGADGQPRSTMAFKFVSAKVEGLPLPRPLYEIFVYSPRVEGIHLRFGKVARGGLRWSDRPQDFRTEVLGLVKAQQVKNAVIVPVGAKGGFFPKLLPPASERAAWLAEGTESYRIFVRTLLELTDNLDGEKVIPPENTVRHDGDDPYLVVAADKGTATFSDTANALSLEKGHWLGDAFASGGSQGYDHKKMGITARGAWEAVKRHFREMDVDIQTMPFSVAGVGDMSGDVFGNGMLLSKAIRLVAAFDHRDIFLDPDPDTASSLAERERMFNLPRSSWQDYDKTLISAGGGVFPRSAKSIPLSPQVRTLLDINQAEATPQEVMTAILKAQVDLLWFGGIGTYIRAGTESDAQVGDRANDAIRITGAQLRAKVVGEGANLGTTQLGRIEAALAGVRLNTDAIDNSAGVNTSDVEVNIKIALSTPERDGRLKADARNALLAAMTDEVGTLVLRNNYLQTLALSLSQQKGMGELAMARTQMRQLEDAGQLNRGVEYLPDDAALMAREDAGKSLTRPELAVLLAYAKLSLHDELLASGIPDEPYLNVELTRYFPSQLRETYPDAVAGHRLRREIVATQLANAVVNRGGPTLVARLSDETGANGPAIARAYVLTRDAFGLLDLNLAIDALDARISGATQLALYGVVQDVLVARMMWFLRNLDMTQPLDAQVGRFAAGVAAVRAAMLSLLGPGQLAERDRRIEEWTRSGVPAALAARIVDLPGLEAAPDGVVVAEAAKASVIDAVATLFGLAQSLDAGRVKAAAATIKPANRFERLAIERGLERIDLALRRMAVEILRDAPASPEAVPRWLEMRQDVVARVNRSLRDAISGTVTPAKLTVAAALLDDLVR